MNQDLAYCAATYTPDQVRPHAESCKDTGCPSYIHCFFGIARTTKFGGYANPVCSQTILLEMERQQPGGSA